MIDKLDRKLCSGCTACKAACPKHCITMQKDEEGFNYPIINTEICINCNLCENVCPVLHKQDINANTQAYAVMNKNEQVRLNSTSGGFFTVLAEYVLDKNGYVVGAAYNDKFVVEHIIIHDKEELYKLRGAKYSQSELGNAFVKVKELLDNNQWVLFSGTPCQIGGLKAYLRNEYEKLITVDLICHGVPSPKVWEKYVEYRSINDNNGELPININLRSKISGWSKYGYSVIFDYGTHQYSSINNQDPFMKSFVGDYCLRPSCSNCSFKGIHRASNFTLGDYWGVWDQIPEMDDNKGTSVVFVHDAKAKLIFDSICYTVNYKQVDCEDSIIMNPSMIRSSVAKKERKEFLNKVNEDLDAAMNKYILVEANKDNNLFNRVKRIIKRLIS